MTDLRKLLEAATKARADVAKDEGEAGENYRAYMRAKHALKTEALNALPALLDIVEVAQRLIDARAALLLPDGVNAAEEYFSAAAELATLRATITRLEGERDRYRAALESVEQFFLRPGEDANEKFERIGDAFYRDTHMLRPGKDASWACQYTSEERDVAFNSWCAAKAAAARAALQEPKA